VVGDALDPATSEAACAGAHAVLCMLTPLPTAPDFARAHVAATNAVIEATVNAVVPEAWPLLLPAAITGGEKAARSVPGPGPGPGNSRGASHGHQPTPSPPYREEPQQARRRLVVVGGAGVMSRSWGPFVTDSLPGSAVRALLPVKGSRSSPPQQALSTV